MYDIPIKYSITSLLASISGAGSVISEHTLIPLSIFVVCTGFLVAGAWKVSSAVTKAVSRMEGAERRLSVVEKDIKEIKERVK